MRFAFARTPRLEFGPGSIDRVPSVIGGSFSAVALVTGGASFSRSPKKTELSGTLRSSSLSVFEFACPGEPSVGFVDAAVATLSDALPPEAADRIAVVAVGGGSAMDAGKAIAAMLPLAARSARLGRAPSSIAQFLEGVGTQVPGGETAFMIACPTTAGTGSEATKNAVISRIGPGGFKKSLRHENYVPAAAVIDPELAIGCPRSVTAGSGLDAFTQLLEAWTSPMASPMTDALCESGVAAFARSFDGVLADGGDLEARSGMAYAAYLSGLGLANAGLGAVHALASPVGGRFEIPHGTFCGLLLPLATRLNVGRLEGMGAGAADAAAGALRKYSRAGYVLASKGGAARAATPERDSLSFGLGLLFDELARLEELASLPRLSAFGMSAADLPELAVAASAKTNPVPLSAEDYAGLLAGAL